MTDKPANTLGLYIAGAIALMLVVVAVFVASAIVQTWTAEMSWAVIASGMSIGGVAVVGFTLAMLAVINHQRQQLAPPQQRQDGQLRLTAQEWIALELHRGKVNPPQLPTRIVGPVVSGGDWQDVYEGGQE